MDMVGGSAQSAVDSLLGRLSSVLVEEAQLLRNVHGDMQFIKREMESMNGFLLDAADDGRGNDNNQVRAWRRQVHELAFDSQSCVDRYVHTFGARHPAAGAGLLASLGRVPELVRTLPTRHRIAAEIKELKDRALEVGERRLRYGVVITPASMVVPASSTLVARRRAAVANQEADDVRRRSVLDSARALFDDNERAKELVGWLMGAPPAVPRGRVRRNQIVTAGQLIKKLVTGGGGANDFYDLIMEVIKLIRGISDNDNPENFVEGAGYLREALQQVDEQEVKVMSRWLLAMLLGRADMPQETNKDGAGVGHELLADVLKAVHVPMEKFLKHADALAHLNLTYSIIDSTSAIKHLRAAIQDLMHVFMALRGPMERFLGMAKPNTVPPKDLSSSSEEKDGSSSDRRHASTAPAAHENLLEMVKNAKEPMELTRAEARYILMWFFWLWQVLYHSKIHGDQYPKVVTIVTPPVEDMSRGDGPEEPLLEDTHATELARKVYDHPSTSNYFSTKVWVDAKKNSDLKQMLLSILHQVQQQNSDSGSSATPGADSSGGGGGGDHKDVKSATDQNKKLKTKNGLGSGATPGANSSSGGGSGGGGGDHKDVKPATDQNKKLKTKKGSGSGATPGANSSSDGGGGGGSEHKVVKPATDQNKKLKTENGSGSGATPGANSSSGGCSDGGGHDHKDVKLATDHNKKLKTKNDSGSGATPGANSSSGGGSGGDDHKDVKPTKDSNEELKTKIAKCLKDKRFLIVLAEVEDNNSWQVITSGLPNHGDSAVIVTPRINYMAQFHAWYTANWVFLVTGVTSRYHVHFCSNLVGIGKVAAQLVGSDQLPADISAVLKKCLWDSFATRMFLHALYVNPQRSDGELERLMFGLRYASSVSNARRMVQFCYEDLPRQYQSCLLSLSIFPPQQEGKGERMKLKRTSLVRRWAAENFVSARDGLAAVDEADRCFDALIARGLLEPADIGAAGRVKTCTLDPRVLSFIAKMARSDAIITNNWDLPPNMAHYLSTSSVVLQRLMTDQSPANSNTCWGMIHRSRRRHTTASTSPPATSAGAGRHTTASTSPPAAGAGHTTASATGSTTASTGPPAVDAGHTTASANSSTTTSTSPPAAGAGDSSSQSHKDDGVVTFLTSLPASSDQLGLVKLLDLEGCKGLTKRRLKKICNKIFQLKYLSLRNTDAAELPKEINRLRYLETLDIRETTIESFPSNTIALPKLMHFLAGRRLSNRSFSTVQLPTGIGSMTNMQVMSHVEVSKDDEDEFRNVGRKLHLRKLGVVVRGEQPLMVLLRVVGMLHESLCSLSIHLHQAEHSEGDAHASAVLGNDGGSHPLTINATEIPKSLESLNINGKVNELPAWVRQLHRLSKITLCGTSLRGVDLHRLGELANLRCIRLLDQSYAELKFTFNTREFRKLELLIIIGDSGISDVHFAENAAPSLKKIDWSFTSDKIALSGIKRLPNLKEVHLHGNCGGKDKSTIEKEVYENPNLPILSFNQ